MASAFDDDKDSSGTRTGVFDEIDRQRGIVPSPPAAEVTARRGFGDVLRGAAQTADDVVRAAADTMTFGLLDRALGEKEIKKTLEARERSPYATIGGDVAGGVATMAATPLRAVGAGAAALAGGAQAGLRGIAGRAAGYGAEGALFGGAQAAGHTYDLPSLPGNVAQGTAIGGVAGGLTGPLASRSSLTPRPRAEVPSPADLGQATDLLYTAGRNNPAGVYHAGASVRTATDDIKQQLYAQGFNEVNAKNTFTTLNRVAQSQAQASRAGGTATFSPGNIESIRQGLNKSSMDSDIAASTAAKRLLDAFTASPTAGGLAGGTVAGAQATDAIFQAARGNAAANIRSGILREAEENVANRSAATHSGLNYENNMRSKIASILASEGRSFPRAEREQLTDLARRSDAWNNVRTVGNMLGGGGGIGSWVAPAVLGGAGGAAGAYGTGDPFTTALGVAAPIVAGRTLRGMSNRSMQRAVGEMDEIIRSASPEFARRQAITPGTVAGEGMSSLGLASRNALIEALMRREQDNPLKIEVRPGMYR